MRILYSVQGDGKGHAIRSSVSIEWLKSKGHNVLITASNDAYPILQKKFGHVVRIEGARMIYDGDSMLVGKTVNEFFKNFSARMKKNLNVFYTIGLNFKPDIVITDMEPMAYYFAKFFNTPLISIDNNSFIARCKDVPMPKGDRDIFMATRLMFGFWTPFADKYIISTFIKQTPRQKNVIFVPKVFNIQEVLYAIDVFVMPSLNEGLGLGLMEAMAWGKAVIGSDVGGIRNLIQNNFNGILVDPADTIQLSEAIMELLENPDKALILGNNARILINEKFSLENMVLKTEEVYYECLSIKE